MRLLERQQRNKRTHDLLKRAWRGAKPGLQSVIVAARGFRASSFGGSCLNSLPDALQVNIVATIEIYFSDFNHV